MRQTRKLGLEFLLFSPYNIRTIKLMLRFMVFCKYTIMKSYNIPLLYYVFDLGLRINADTATEVTSSFH